MASTVEIVMLARNTKKILQLTFGMFKIFFTIKSNVFHNGI